MARRGRRGRSRFAHVLASPLCLRLTVGSFIRRDLHFGFTRLRDRRGGRRMNERSFNKPRGNLEREMRRARQHSRRVHGAISGRYEQDRWDRESFTVATRYVPHYSQIRVWLTVTCVKVKRRVHGRLPIERHSTKAPITMAQRSIEVLNIRVILPGR